MKKLFWIPLPIVSFKWPSWASMRLFWLTIAAVAQILTFFRLNPTTSHGPKAINSPLIFYKIYELEAKLRLKRIVRARETRAVTLWRLTNLRASVWRLYQCTPLNNPSVLPSTAWGARARTAWEMVHMIMTLLLLLPPSLLQLPDHIAQSWLVAWGLFFVFITCSSWQHSCIRHSFLCVSFAV